MELVTNNRPDILVYKSHKKEVKRDIAVPLSSDAPPPLQNETHLEKIKNKYKDS